MRNNVFMNLVEYERKRKPWTVKYLCEEYDIDQKEYNWYLKGIKTPPKEDIEMAIILIVAGICTALILAR